MTGTDGDNEPPLNPVEQLLIAHVERGELLDLAGDEPVDEAAMRSWDQSQTVSAVVVRDVVLGRLAHGIDPHGLRLRGARISGRIDLENISAAAMAIELVDCLLGEGLNARDTKLLSLALPGCHLEHPAEPALDAERLTATVLDLAGLTATAHSTRGAIALPSAHLGQLACGGAQLHNDTGPALNAERLRVDQSVYFHHKFTAVGAGEGGAIRLYGASVGALNCGGAKLRNDTGPALAADDLQVDQDVSLDKLTAVGAGKDGAVRLADARLGSLDCGGANLRNDSGPALFADRLRVNQSVFLRDEFTAVGSRRLGAVRLVGARLGGLECDGANLRNDSGPALFADRLRVDHDVFLRRGSISGFGGGGSSGVQVLRRGFNAVGAGKQGAVRLVGAHLGALDCGGAKLRNDTGPALHAVRLRVDQSVFLRDEFTAVGAGEKGAVRLVEANVGSLDCHNANLRNDTGPALAAGSLKVGQNVFMHHGFEAVGAGDDVAVNLAGVDVGGFLVFNPQRLEHRISAHRRLRVDGLIYAGLPRGLSSTAWLELLRNGTPEYAAQPYQHLAAAQRAAGHDRTARQILMAQRRDQIHRQALTGHGERAWAQFTGLVLGYGYQPWRALIGLALVITTAVALAVILGSHGGLIQVRTPPLPTPTECSWVERVGVGLDPGTPLITTSAQTRCQTTNSATGQTLAISGWALRLLAWAFATLFIAGFTTAVRRT